MLNLNRTLLVLVAIVAFGLAAILIAHPWHLTIPSEY